MTLLTRDELAAYTGLPTSVDAQQVQILLSEAEAEVRLLCTVEGWGFIKATEPTQETQALIDTTVKPFLAYTVTASFVRTGSYHLTPAGPVKHQAQHTTELSGEERAGLAQQWEVKARKYRKLLHLEFTALGWAASEKAPAKNGGFRCRAI